MAVAPDMPPGLFDLPAPALSAFDALAAQALPAWLRVVLYGLLASWLGMKLYARWSHQKRLRAVRQLNRRQQKQLTDPDIAFADLLKLAGRNLRLALYRVWLVLLPTLPSMLPFLFLFAWMSNHFGALPPAVGTPLTWCITPLADAAAMRIDDHRPDERGCVTVPWSGAGLRIEALDQTLTVSAWQGASSVLHVPQWWNRLIANPAGALPAAWGERVVASEFPVRNLLGFGPWWLGHWLFLALVPGTIAGFYWRWRWKLV